MSVTEFLTNIACPACGQDTEADMLHDGYIVASPSEPTLRCRICNTEYKVDFYPIEPEDEEPDNAA